MGFVSRLRLFESTAVSSSLVSGVALVIDALSALPVKGNQQSLPSSLRCSSLVTAACLGSPVIATDLAFEQKLALLVLMATIALVGEHTASDTVRIADAIFTLVCVAATVFIFVLQLPDTPRGAPGSMLAASFICLCGFRAARAGFEHPAATRSFQVFGEFFDTTGYAIGDGLVAAGLAGGGCLLVCNGVIVLSNEQRIKARGISAVAPVVVQNCAFAFAAALVVQLSVYSRMANLQALFGQESCAGGENVCEASWRARRFYISNSNPSSLWAGVIASVVLVVSRDRLCGSRFDFYNRSAWSRGSALALVVVCALSFVIIFSFSTTETSYASVELALLFAAAPAAWFVATWLGGIFAVVGIVLYFNETIEDGGWQNVDFTFFTNNATTTTVILLILISLVSFVESCLWAVPSRLTIRWLEVTNGVLIIALLSVQLILTILTLGLVASYSGAPMDTPESYLHSGYKFSVTHSVTFFVSVAVYGSRFETGDVDGVSLLTRRLAWYISPILVLCAWVTVLLVSNSPSPYGEHSEMSEMYLAAVASLLAWIFCGLSV